MSNCDIIKKKIKLIIFDQYGTIVDMQKGLTEAVIPCLLYTSDAADDP